MNQVKTNNFLFSLLILSIGWIALSGFFYDSKSVVKLSQYYWQGNPFEPRTLTLMTSIWFAFLSLLLVFNLKEKQKISITSNLMLLTATVPLITLIGHIHWAEALGGFPAIGSGQGIIKYFALAALALFLLKPAFLSARQLMWVNYFPVALVLLWIGGMKFTAYEAEGIKGLVESSPFMSWLYLLFDLQTASNIIGVYDILALILLGIGIKFSVPWMSWLGGLMSLSVFAMTQTFLFTFEHSLHTNGLLTSSGVFIIKDLWFIGNLLVLWHYRSKLSSE